MYISIGWDILPVWRDHTPARVHIYVIKAMFLMVLACVLCFSCRGREAGLQSDHHPPAHPLQLGLWVHAPALWQRAHQAPELWGIHPVPPGGWNVCLSVCQSVCVVRLSICLNVCFFVCRLICMSVRLFCPSCPPLSTYPLCLVCLSVHPSVRTSIRAVRPSVCMSVIHTHSVTRAHAHIHTHCKLWGVSPPLGPIAFKHGSLHIERITR